MIKHLEQLVKLAKMKPLSRLAGAQAADKDVLSAIVYAKNQGIADALLVGDGRKIAALLTLMGEKAENYQIIEADTDEKCAYEAVRLIREGRADILMKGLLSTSTLMRAVVDKTYGLRTGGLISHTMFYEVPAYEKLLCVTDGGMNTFPDFEKKEKILKNAVRVCKKLGYERPVCACVCGAENVDPKIQSTLDARDLSLSEELKKEGAVVFGPVGLDLAVSREACAHKGYSAEGAGSADILLVPTYEVGNGIGKAMTYFGGAKSAGIIVGARVPIVLVSRADSAESKLYSIALAALV